METKERGKKMKGISNKGVTLIALVITIIVLLILAGVSIAMLTGENGILTQATESKKANTIGAEKEQIGLAMQSLKMKKQADNVSTIVTPDELQSQLMADGAKNVTVESGDNDSLIVKYQDTKNKYTVGQNGNILENGGNGTNPDNPGTGEGENETYIKTVKELKAGEKVNYIDKSGKTIECIVLYDEEYNISNGTDYGIQVIAKEPVGNLALGKNDVTVEGENEEIKAMNSYNNYYNTLYNKAQEYLNTAITISARSVGSKPNEPNWDSALIKVDSSNVFSYYIESLREIDTNAQIDIDQLTKLNILQTSSEYYIARRINGLDEFVGELSFGTITNSGTQGGSPSVIVSIDGMNEAYNSELPIRPIFTLKSDVKIISGNGSDDPYTLKQ